MQAKARVRAARLHLWKRYGMGLLFMLPWIIGFAMFVIIPISWSLFMSFNKVQVAVGGFKYEWVGLRNFRDAF